jgi:NAD+ synthase (glutamine-hydrolysing)
MSGGLAILSDVPKTMVYELAAHINRKGEVIPRAIIDKPPSAELKPGQLDSDALPPYPLLDAILRAYVEEHRSVGEIAGLGFAADVVRRVAGMVDRSEYKRAQAAPGIRSRPGLRRRTAHADRRQDQPRLTGRRVDAR